MQNGSVGVALSPADIDHFPCGPMEGLEGPLCSRQNLNWVQGFRILQETAQPSLVCKPAAWQYCGWCRNRRRLFAAIWLPFILGTRIFDSDIKVHSIVYRNNNRKAVHSIAYPTNNRKAVYSDAYSNNNRKAVHSIAYCNNNLRHCLP